jgi:site-specific recombinase XerD
MTTSTDFAKYLSRFLSEYLPHERNMSANTIASYRDAFVQFIDYMRCVQQIKIEKLTLEQITRQRVKNFLEWLQKNRNCSISTRNYRLAAIHSFIRYLQYEDINRLNEWQSILAIKAMKTETKSVEYLTVDGIKLLLSQPDMTSSKGRRDLALLSLMYDTGARVQEIIDLRPESLRIEAKPYTVRLLGKGKKSRIVPLMEEQVRFLKIYMDENHLFDINKLKCPLFSNNRHEKLTRAGVSYILCSYAEMARKQQKEVIPDKISCHSLRHSKAMHLLQSGVNLVYIRDLLGHSYIRTTEVYARADSKQKREALEKAYLELMPDISTTREWEKDKNLLEWLKGLKK